MAINSFHTPSESNKLIGKRLQARTIFREVRNTLLVTVNNSYKIIELMVNVLLPALHAWGRLEVKSEWSFFAESSYLSIPAPVQNRNVKIAVQKCFAGLNKDVKVLRSAACVQGVLHLYKAYCEKAHGDCGACLFFNSL